MSVVWVGVAAAVVGGAAAYAGSKKQADAATHAANLSQGQYQNNVQMQQPYVNSGYGALSKMNTLLGINADPNAPKMLTSHQPPTAMQNPPITNAGGGPRDWNYPGQMMQDAPQPTQQKPNSNPQLRQILQIRASSGDPQAKQMLSMMQ